MTDSAPVARTTISAGFSPRGRRAARPHRVAVLAFPHVVLGDLAIPCELFSRARGPGGEPLYDVRVCSHQATVTTSLLRLDVPHRLDVAARADTIVVPGIEPLDAAVPDEVLRTIRRAVDRGARVASVCSGAFVLAATGALDGLRATTHWLGAAELKRRHPAVDVDPNVLYVDNGQVLTSAGAAAGHDLCLHVIRRDFGAEAAAAVARLSVMPLERAGGQAQFIARPPPATDETSIGALLEWLDGHLSQDLALEAVARHAAMSPRTLSRRFRESVGMTPARWIGEARVRRAQHLLETTPLSIERIASEVGFGSSAVLRERFGRIVGTSPVTYRRAFGSSPRAPAASTGT